MNEVAELRKLAGTLDGVCLPGLAELCERAAGRLERLEAENARLTKSITGFIETFTKNEFGCDASQLAGVANASLAVAEFAMEESR